MKNTAFDFGVEVERLFEFLLIEQIQRRLPLHFDFVFLCKNVRGFLEFLFIETKEYFMLI